MVNNARKPFAQKCKVFLHVKEEKICSFIFRVPNPNFCSEPFFSFGFDLQQRKRVHRAEEY